MKLYQYLIESKPFEIEYNDPEIEYNKIYKQCKKYYSLLKTKSPMYRTVQQKVYASDIYYKKRVRSDRRSTLRDEDRKIVNNILKKMGHVRRDNSVSATSDKMHAKKFQFGIGEIYYFLPIGNFNYSWCPSTDFNFPNKDKGWDPIIIRSIKDTNSEEKVEKLLNMVTTNDGFDKAYRNGYEIWFDCKEYFLIPPNSDLGRLLK